MCSHLLVAMDGAASEALRGLKAEKDTDLALIWEALSRRFGFVDEPERAMRRFDVRKQLEGETLAVFEQSLRMLHREAWPKMDIKSPEADSFLRRKFVDGILDLELQKYRLHATSDDFATTVSKARQFVDANELSRTTKKSALRTTSPSVNYQIIIDGVSEALELRDRERMADVNAVQASGSSAGTSGNRNKKAPPRQGSPTPSNSSAGRSSSRASSTGRTVRFQDQADVGAGDRGYESPAGSCWRSNQSPQGDSSSSRPWADHRPPGQGTSRPQSPSSGWSPRQGGPRASSPQSGWSPGQAGPRFRPPAQGNAGNWRPGWRSPCGDRGGQPPVQPQYPPEQRRWSQGSTDQPPPAAAAVPPFRPGCRTCGKQGCHSDSQAWMSRLRAAGLPHCVPWACRCVTQGPTGREMLRLRPTRMLPIPPQTR